MFSQTPCTKPKRLVYMEVVLQLQMVSVATQIASGVGQNRLVVDSAWFPHWSDVRAMNILPLGFLVCRHHRHSGRPGLSFHHPPRNGQVCGQT
jgi:hypothetical protein